MPANVTPIPIGPRIAIYGASGSGKSTLGATLGKKLGLPYVELDSIFHAHPGWVDLEPEEFRERVTELLTAYPDGWVFDGNYGTVRDLILAQADTAIWLRPLSSGSRRTSGRTPDSISRSQDRARSRRVSADANARAYPSRNARYEL